MEQIAGAQDDCYIMIIITSFSSMEGLGFRNGRVRLHEFSSFPALRLFNPQSIITICVCMFACVSVYMYNYYAVEIYS